jgi:hypothetical protein
MTEVTEHRADKNEEPLNDLVWPAAERASSWALQGEITVQTRFGNFLLADSFLLLSWATVYSGSSGTSGRTAVLAVLALISALLGAVFALLGSRFAKFVHLQWELATRAERQLPKTLTRFGEQVDALRRHEAVYSEKGKPYRLSWLEFRVSTSALTIWAPAGLCITSLALLALSFLPR